jgi:hypothetical protein
MGNTSDTASPTERDVEQTQREKWLIACRIIGWPESEVIDEIGPFTSISYSSVIQMRDALIALADRAERAERAQDESGSARVMAVYRAAVRLGDAWERARDGEIGGLASANADLFAALQIDIPATDGDPNAD